MGCSGSVTHGQKTNHSAVSIHYYTWSWVRVIAEAPEQEGCKSNCRMTIVWAEKPRDRQAASVSLIESNVHNTSPIDNFTPPTEHTHQTFVCFRVRSRKTVTAKKGARPCRVVGEDENQPRGAVATGRRDRFLRNALCLPPSVKCPSRRTTPDLPSRT